ncbi:cytochrome c oxidase subunit 1 [Hydrogenivirga caldilitoris]|uniref:Cytochrome c oxidase subunit 1 n=1 Tax=Hydrogenivirga caldilitoris TaxID=246264 RepID=A0A497XQL6_9AQUI|nr:cbb3-type cytochrome c oxidase subunit I [Hydrogenivirga caldilitoris]RLJ71286.1 cytochrome c oxidase subunit 1 [Hydrogenivirga caldilitoris]
MRVEGSIRFIILSEIVFPILLLVFGVYHGVMQVLYRAGIIKADSFLGIDYYQGLTLHGVINAIVFTTFFAVAFGNAVVLYLLKKPLRPAIQWLSWILMVGGTLMAAWAMFTKKATLLYTFYPPLIGHWTFYIGTVLLVVGSLLPFFFDWIPNAIAWRREKQEKLPLAVFGVFVNHTLWTIMIVPVAIEILFQLFPLSVGWVDEINPLLARTLFWFFGHPVVYFWLLPAYVMLYTMLPKIASEKGKLYSDQAARLAFILFLLFSLPVGLHHQFTEPGISNAWKLIHAIFTFCVALPSLITAFTVAASLEYSAKAEDPSVKNSKFYWWMRLPYLRLEGDKWLLSYLFAGLVLFFFGGITGIVNASYNLNLAVHNTAYVPGHFHTTVGGLVLLAFLGMSLYMVSKLRGTEVKFKGLAALAPYFWMQGMFMFSYAMMVGGALEGFPRRTNAGLTYLNPDSPLYRPEWVGYAQLSVVGGVLLGIGFLFFLIAFLGTLLAPKVREATVEFPIAEAYHDGPSTVLNNLKGWTVAAVLLAVLSYIPPLYDVTQRGVFQNSPAYNEQYPIPLKQLQQTQKESKELSLREER